MNYSHLEIDYSIGLAICDEAENESSRIQVFPT